MKLKASWCHQHEAWECAHIEGAGAPPDVPRVCCHKPVRATVKPDGTSKAPWCSKHRKEREQSNGVMVP